MKKKTDKPGFSYSVEDDVRHRYSKLSPEVKLQWLAEAAEFIDKASTPKTRRLRKKFREGKI
ncbi:MAG: hypothetical protein P9X24_08690 [Candidatus Hatepunaea meridiana]|nr:hypothetical protein [Candidatus Hatepunaea meridiana]